MPKNQTLSKSQKPQLARRYDGVHASCTIPKFECFYNCMIFNDLIFDSDLAHCLQ